jgi:hypothetical protein
VSRCEPETNRCTHVFEIAGYSLHKDVDPNEFIQSATFTVGGHDWCIQFFPNGEGLDTEGLEHPGRVCYPAPREPGLPPRLWPAIARSMWCKGLCLGEAPNQPGPKKNVFDSTPAARHKVILQLKSPEATAGS